VSHSSFPTHRQSHLSLVDSPPEKGFERRNVCVRDADSVQLLILLCAADREDRYILRSAFQDLSECLRGLGTTHIHIHIHIHIAMIRKQFWTVPGTCLPHALSQQLPVNRVNEAESCTPGCIWLDVGAIREDYILWLFPVVSKPTRTRAHPRMLYRQGEAL